MARNFSYCGEDVIFWWFYETETYLFKMRYGDFVDETFNTTLFLQNTTEVAFTCTDAVENIYFFYDLKVEQFPTFDDLFLGLLQSILQRDATKVDLGEYIRAGRSRGRGQLLQVLVLRWNHSQSFPSL